MSKDETRKLLGGYATDSLTEAERTALFQAALEDQELFDELAGEQVLKEVLDEPGARQRLIAALEPPRHLGWFWVTAATAASLAIVMGVVISQRTPPPPQEIAQVMKSPQPAAAPAVPPAAQSAAPRVAAPPPAPPPPPVERLKVVPSPAPAASELQKAEAENRLADQIQPVRPQAAAGVVREFAAGPPAPKALRSRNETVTVTQTVGPVEFSYAVSADGILQIATVEMGFVSVTAVLTDRDDVIYPSAALAANTTIRIQIPADATELIIGFSKTPAVNNSRIQRPLVPGLGFDQDPPNATFRLQVPAKP